MKTTATNKPCTKRLQEFAQLKVECPFSCGIVSKIAKMEKHENFICPKRPVQCPFIGCNDCKSGAEILNHIKSCFFRSIYCPNCSLPVRLNGFSSHNCIQALKNTIKTLENQVRFVPLGTPFTVTSMGLLLE